MVVGAHTRQCAHGRRFRATVATSILIKTILPELIDEPRGGARRPGSSGTDEDACPRRHASAAAVTRHSRMSARYGHCRVASDAGYAGCRRRWRRRHGRRTINDQDDDRIVCNAASSSPSGTKFSKRAATVPSASITNVHSCDTSPHSSRRGETTARDRSPLISCGLS